ncbi:triacylglycerol lipase SDP1-like [Zingiber officinale]|uniref:PNPLA domain-containing protein n=1 Tax=Zingiber officinale TaxID=94328 RepID=A0A8J5HY70_ZINOF|nr:triacylglycerol lipase SDP1-like [Zingiber officinale]KAG6536067.1 hypothetical protein ZIOFF_001109 [Zingiber officinale]
MDNKAAVDAFSIAPSIVLGRTIALRVLLCGSLRLLRRRLSFLILIVLGRLRSGARHLLAWLHPRNAQGTLGLVTIVAFALRRFGNVRAEFGYRRRFWRNMLHSALTYEEWSHAAKMLESDMTPKMRESDLYDEELVRNKLQELRHRRREGSLRDIVFCMRTDILRNLGNMCNPELHKGRHQVPKLIKEYIDEVSTQLKMVCDSDSDELLLEEKLAFMHETRHAFGRTALLLSGGASLGAFHVGVVRTLVEHKLLPRIIAGSSVGSVICAVVATRSWPELECFFENSWHSLQFFDQLGGIFTVVKRIMTHGAVHEIRQLQSLLRHLTSNLTFQEAYDMTGIVLGITVCSPRKHESPRCLNYLTSPHVVIWSAVTASCAFPGLFEAQELMAKDRFGEIVPFHAPFSLGMEDNPKASARRWRDGSLESDLPMIQLKELFNVNHFIVSQANPHIAPLLRVKEIIRVYGGNFAAKLAHLVEMEVKHRCNQVLELGIPLGGLAKLFAQDWEGDVTVVMPATLAQYSKIIQNPSRVELQKAANQGRRCTWEKLSAIKANCAIELVLDECVVLLNRSRSLKRSAKRDATSQSLTNFMRLNAAGRIPSWNCIARENSADSLEEDLVAESAASIHQGNPTAGQSNRHRQTQQGTHDGSDSESESESADLNSWTRSGGPLMRTTSAVIFINFVQKLETETECSRFGEEEIDTSATQFNLIGSQAVGGGTYYNNSRVITPDRSSENADSKSSSRVPVAASTSITLSEGDLLQTEKVHNGIVFNIVKKATLLRGSSNPELHQDCCRVADEENVPAEICDSSKTSDLGKEDDNPTPNQDYKSLYRGDDCIYGSNGMNGSGSSGHV